MSDYSILVTLDISEEGMERFLNRSDELVHGEVKNMGNDFFMIVSPTMKQYWDCDEGNIKHGGMEWNRSLLAQNVKKGICLATERHFKATKEKREDDFVLIGLSRIRVAKNPKYVAKNTCAGPGCGNRGKLFCKLCGSCFCSQKCFTWESHPGSFKNDLDVVGSVDNRDICAISIKKMAKNEPKVEKQWNKTLEFIEFRKESSYIVELETHETGRYKIDFHGRIIYFGIHDEELTKDSFTCQIPCDSKD